MCKVTKPSKRESDLKWNVKKVIMWLKRKKKVGLLVEWESRGSKTTKQDIPQIIIYDIFYLGCTFKLSSP